MSASGDAPRSFVTEDANADEMSSASEDRVRASVDALTAALGLDVRHRLTQTLASASTTMLGKMISRYDVTKVAVTQTRRVLSERADDAEAFGRAYDALKTLRVEELDRYLAVVAKIAMDEELAFAVSEAGGRVAAAEGAAGVTSAARGLDYDGDANANATMTTISSSSPGGLGTPDRYVRVFGDDGDERRRGGGPGTASPSSSTKSLAGAFEAKMRVDAPESVRKRASVGKPERTLVTTQENALARLPEWNYERPFLTGAHLGGGAEQDRNVKSLSEYSTAEQELLILDDLLYAMMGIDGRYISAWRGTDEDADYAVVTVRDSRLARVKFEVELGLEASLSALTKNMMPLCSDAATIRAFIESRQEFKHGYVSHALAADMRELLNDWHTLIVQLEHQRNVGALSLQSAWFYCQPAASALRLMANVASRAYHLKGASVLNLLHREGADHAGDNAVSVLVQRLSKAAAAPYIRAVELWVYDGQVDDPYDEFLIVEQNSMKKESLMDDYNAVFWSKRYSLRGDIPHFIGDQLAQKILTTGKYLNAMRETDVASLATLPPRPNDGLGKIPFDANALIGTGKYADRIGERFELAANALLRQVWDRGELRTRLASMKMYFLISQGDYLVHFLDTAKSELAKDANTIRASKLQSLLDMAVKSASTAIDKHGDDLRCSVDVNQLLGLVGVSGDETIVSPMKVDDRDEASTSGYDTFMLDYVAPWPASLVLSRRALTKYQIVFRHVFHFKCIERSVCSTWQTLHHIRDRSMTAMFAKLHKLTQRMINFLQNYLYYVTCEVIEPNWHAMSADLDTARTVDEIIGIHDAFLDKCMKQSMLFWPKILKRLDRLKATCLRFARDGERFADAARRAKAEVTDAVTATKLGVLEEEMTAVVSDTQSQFDHLLEDFLNVLNDSGHLEPNLASLCSRLDFNGFYVHGGA